MKKILNIILIITVFSCKAQSIIVPIGSGEEFQKNPTYYKKDVNNEFGKFEGNWKYQNGNTEINFKLKKEEHYQASEGYNYRDLLVGEYQYIEDGVEKVNTLSKFNSISVSGYDHSISGGVFIHQSPNYCIDNSDIQEIKIELFIEDPNNHLIEGRIILRYVIEDDIEKLQVCIYDRTTLADDVTARIDIPDGYYEFVKQE
jgi:hypothetical protein